MVSAPLKLSMFWQLSADPENVKIDVDSFRKHCLLNGLGDIGLTPGKVGQIHAYEERRQQEVPWLFT